MDIPEETTRLGFAEVCSQSVMDSSSLTGAVISAAIAVHTELGPGLLESIYEVCLVRELTLRGFRVKQQVRIPISYKGHYLDKYLILDLVVEEQVIVEVKSAEQNHPLHKAQLISYLRLSGMKEGLVLNFGLTTLREGIQRAVHQLNRT